MQHESYSPQENHFRLEAGTRILCRSKLNKIFVKEKSEKKRSSAGSLKKTRPAGGKTTPRHFAKKKTSRRLRKPPNPVPPIHSGTVTHVRTTTMAWARP